MKYSHLTLKVFSLIVLNDIVDSVAQLVMKKGLIFAGVGSITIANMWESVLGGVSSPLLWVGVLLYIFNFFVWIVILYKIDLSVAMPVGSTCYILVPLAAVFFLHEKVSLMRWAGVFCIVAGIHFVAQTKKTDHKKAAA